MEPKSYYLSNLEKYNSEEKKLSKKVNYVSVIRLFCMVLFVFFLVKGIQQNKLTFFILSAISLISFFSFVAFYKKLTDERRKKRILKTINQQELDALNGNYHKFSEGTHFLDPDHEFTYDLDIFGPSSLFQYICRCCTLSGEKVLASRFLNSPLKKEDILSYQQIHEELSENPDFMQDYLASGKTIEEKPGEIQQIRNWLNNSGSGIKKWTHFFALVLAIINISLILTTILFDGWGKYLIISVLTSWFFYGFFISRINRYHADFGKKQEIIRKYNVLSRVFSKTGFRNSFFLKVKEKSTKSLKQFRRLEILMDMFDSRLNLLMGAILNTLLLLDFHLIKLLENWKKHNGTLLNDIFNLHAKTDAFISGGVFLFNHPHYVKAKPGNEVLSAKKLGHPLIKPGECITNDFELQKNEKIIIITGANMAGKSTFLRTLGTNLILAGAGFHVYADEFRFSIQPVITGMRTTDSLTESESYFFAELKRMKKIMDRLRNGEQLFILLDEILKGTNSKDKHQGSEELMKQIVDYNCNVFIATHDLQLSDLEKSFPENIKNYHFESHIKADELYFDYKIQKGKAKNMNASFLLRKMGVLK